MVITLIYFSAHLTVRKREKKKEEKQKEKTLQKENVKFKSAKNGNIERNLCIKNIN